MVLNRLPGVFWQPPRCYFFDDFIGSLYDDRVWAATGTGGTITLYASGVSGILQLRANANSYYYMHQSDYAAFNVANKFVATWRFKLPSTANIITSIGLFSAEFYFVVLRNGATNWTAHTIDSGGETATDTGIAVDTNWHEVLIQAVAAGVEFWLDGVLVATNTTHIPANNLQPHIYVSSTTNATKDLYLDYITAEGDRE
jgi:hypothetical protein